MKILIVSDAWLPQVNGVVRTLQATCRELEKRGHGVKVVGPDVSSLWTFALPSYAEIVLEFFPSARLLREIKAFAPDSLHIATEGPLGWSARRLCLKFGWAFTTAYHTRFPQYFAARAPYGFRLLTAHLAYFILRFFHCQSCAVMAATATIVADLTKHKFRNVVMWSRGVDTELFTLYGKGFAPYSKLQRPILLYVGRVSTEKNLADFLCLHTNGSKVVIGSGPDQGKLSRAFPDVHFLGRMEGEGLAKAYAAADLFVFPSKSDTFGLVLLEACAAGLRIAAYPVAGPKDIFSDPDACSFVALDDDLQLAVERALALPESPQDPRKFAERHAWGAATAQFCAHLRPLTHKKSQK
ncbi:MAG: glycosyltransferase family 1 protein [Alphaproteobacteria bacterium]|nr:glycosyltransferase family 1 protein [Alphaproteobacteria bacterium]